MKFWVYATHWILNIGMGKHEIKMLKKDIYYEMSQSIHENMQEQEI